VVSAIAATYGGIAALLAVIAWGEHLGGGGGAGVILAVGGVVMAAAQASGRKAAGKARGSGVGLALASAVTCGTGSFALRGFSARVGWLAAALVAYGSSVAALVLAMPFRLARDRGRRASR
jgi:drug/metabolite transporter (DMT)-like permease